MPRQGAGRALLVGAVGGGRAAAVPRRGARDRAADRHRGPLREVVPATTRARYGRVRGRHRGDRRRDGVDLVRRTGQAARRHCRSAKQAARNREEQRGVGTRSDGCVQRLHRQGRDPRRARQRYPGRTRTRPDRTRRADPGGRQHQRAVCRPARRRSARVPPAWGHAPHPQGVRTRRITVAARVRAARA